MLPKCYKAASSSWVNTVDLGSHGSALGGFPVLPFEDGLFVDPVASGQDLQALLTMLDFPTNRLCRLSAVMKYLSHL